MERETKFNVSVSYSAKFSEENRSAEIVHFVSFSIFFIQIKICELHMFLFNLKILF